MEKMPGERLSLKTKIGFGMGDIFQLLVDDSMVELHEIDQDFCGRWFHHLAPCF